MTTAYPAGLDAFTNPTSGNNLNDASVLHADQHTNKNDAIEAIEAELGTDPSDVFATVKARILGLFPPGAMVPTAGTNFLGPFSLSGGAVTTLGPYDGSAAEQGVLFQIPRPVTVDQVGIEIATGAAVNAKVLLYVSDNQGLPAGSPVLTTGAISCAAAGNAIHTLGVAVNLAGGVYWGRIITDTGASAVRFKGYTQAVGTSVATSHNQIQSNPVVVPKFTVGTYASPAAPTITFGNQPASNVPVISLRRSA